MDEGELNKRIENAITKCQEIISTHPNVVMSEADFERLLCHCISEQIGEELVKIPSEGRFSVHTQISHFIKYNGGHKVGERVDILLLDENIVEKSKVRGKTVKYVGPSVAFELKYLHPGDSATVVNNDFKKWDRIKTESSLFIVVLLEMKNDKFFERKKNKILSIYNNIIKDKDKETDSKKLYCFVLQKKL